MSDLPDRILGVVVPVDWPGMIAVGVIYLLDVFSRVRDVLNDPQVLTKITAEDSPK